MLHPGSGAGTLKPKFRKILVEFSAIQTGRIRGKNRFPPTNRQQSLPH